MELYKNIKIVAKIALVLFGLSYSLGFVKTGEFCYYKQIKTLNSRAEYKDLEKRVMKIDFPFNEMSAKEFFYLRKNLGVEKEPIDFEVPYDKIDSLYNVWNKK